MQLSVIVIEELPFGQRHQYVWPFQSLDAYHRVQKTHHLRSKTNKDIKQITQVNTTRTNRSFDHQDRAAIGKKMLDMERERKAKK